MFDSYFSPGQQCALAAAFLLAVLAMFFHARERDKVALGLLLAAALVVRLFAALLDPYLNMWDESVHAVVAKNMTENPFKPMLLREEALGMPITNWTENHVWLHKQPLFLWIMALSIKLLGPTVLAVRLPSVLFSTAWVYFTHGTVKALHGRNTAFITALMLTFTHWVISQVAGFEPTDHNDVAFVAFVGGSLWAWFVVLPRNSRRGSVLIGVFAGCAVLTKWLVGLLVFAGWGATILAFGPDRLVRGVHMLRALLIAVAIAAPWQIWAWTMFPDEMCNEMRYNARHFSEVLEGHGGTSAFYFEVFPDKLPPLEPYLVSIFTLLGLITIKDRYSRLHGLVTVIGPFVFFTMAESKMASYILPVLPFILMGVAYAIDRCAAVSMPSRWGDGVRFCAAGLLAFALLNIPRLQERHTTDCASDHYYARYIPARTANRAALGELDRLIGGVPRTVVFHVPYPENMNLAYFYGHEALPWLPGPAMCERLRVAGCSIIVIDPPWTADEFPPYVRVIRKEPRMFQRPE